MKSYKNIFRALFFVFCLLPSFLWSQQLPYRSALSNNDFLFNPSMTAIQQSIQINTVFRKQWWGFNGAPQVFGASFQLPLDASNMGIGAALMQDQHGDLKKNQIHFSYRYSIPTRLFENDYLTIGLMGYYEFHLFDGSFIQAKEATDKLIVSASKTQTNINLGFGGYYTTNKAPRRNETAIFIGIASNQFLPQNLIFTETTHKANFKRVRHFNGTLGAKIHNNIGIIQPSLWINYANPNLYLIDLNFKIELTDLGWAGLSFSSNNSARIQLGFILSDLWEDGQNLRIGSSGIFMLSKIKESLAPGMEIYVAYEIQ